MWDLLGFLARSAISVSNLFKRETFLSRSLEACHRSFELDDILEALVEGVLHDFGEHVGDGLTDLGVDAAFKVLLGVTNVNVVLIILQISVLLKALAVLIKVEKVVRADICAIARINLVLALTVDELRTARTLRHEAFGLRETVLLAVELGDQEVSNSLELLCVVPGTSGSTFLTLETIGGRGAV